MNKLKNKIKNFCDIDRFMVILFDVIKIQNNLVCSRHTGDLIDFVNLGDVDLNYATLQETNAIASHVLNSLLRSVVTPFKFSLAEVPIKMPQPVNYSHCSKKLRHSAQCKLLLLLVMGHQLIVNFSTYTLD